MIKKLLAATVLVFGLGVTTVTAQEVIRGPADHEKLMMTHGAVCSGAKDMKEFLDTNEYAPIFDGKNDIVSTGKKDKPSTSYAETLYSDKNKSSVTIIYDIPNNIACIISGISDVKVNEKGINRSLGLKH